MKVAISGSTGFIGQYLKAFLTAKGVSVIPLHRAYFESQDLRPLEDALSGVDVVINLAGAPINHRWTKTYKQKILDSRIRVTGKLVEAMNKVLIKPHTFISVSAVGIYPSDKVCSEQCTEFGTSFLSQVCLRWEREAQQVSPEIRLVIPRLGVVLAHDAGALPKMLLPFRFFLGGRIASGKQGFSWIHIYDLLEAFYFLMLNQTLSGVFNLTAPQLLINKDFAHLTARELGRPDWLPVPAILLNALYGEGASLMTQGQQVCPERLLTSGFHFKYDKLYLALQNLL